MKLACCQLNIAWEDKAVNYRRAESLVAAAGLEPGTLLLLPEMFATGFTMNAAGMAEPITGSTAQFLGDLARRHTLFVQGGVIVRDERAVRPRNEALVFDPAGRLVARYAKMHLFSFAREPEHYSPGEKVVTFEVSVGKNGATPPDSITTTAAASICYDLRFPELYRQAVRSGAEILTVIACWPSVRQEHWRTLLRARSIENQCYLAGVNRCGHDFMRLDYAGGSQIIDPRGEILAEAGGGDEVIQAEIDLEGLRKYRSEFPALADAIL